MQTQRKPIIVGIGEILWDMLPDGRRLGGAPANFAYHTHSLGAIGIAVSAVGNDSDGREIYDRLSALEIQADYLYKAAGYPTGTVSVELTSDGQAIYTIHSPVAWDHIPWSDSLKKLAKQCDAVCFGSLAQRSPVSRITIQKFLESTSESCLRVFDVNIRQDFTTAEVVQQSLSLSDILKLNDDELPVVIEMLGFAAGDDDEIINKLISHYNLMCVILTKGAKGSVLYTKDDISYCQGQDVLIEDTVGAGDSFTAAVIMGLLEKKSLESVHKRASRIADYVCTQPGATPKLNQELISY